MRPACLAAIALPMLLAGCGGGAEGQFAPACPRPSIPTDFNDLHRYKGAGRDITDSVLDGRILAVDGTCANETSRVVAATLTVSLELSRGPAATGRVANVGYFVAVSDGERILDKQVFNIAPEFPENNSRIRLTSETIELKLPVSAGSGGKAASSYRISVGFQLSAAELAENRRRMGGR